MLQLTINEKGGQSRQESFDKNEITIGRVQGNDIILPKGNISKRHSRIVLKDGKFIIVDLKSTNGTYVNGKKISAPQVVKGTDKIYIGDFTIQLNTGGQSAPDRQASLRGGTPAPEAQEIDLFGGDAPADGADAAPAGSPGLIDDNFDQEFDAPEPDAPKLPKPSRRSAPPKAAEPEPEPALELDADFDAPDGDDDAGPDLALELDVDGGVDLDADDGFDPEPEPEPEPDPEPDPAPRPSSLPKAKNRTPPRGASRVRPAPAATSRPEPAPEPEADFDEPATPGRGSELPQSPIVPAAPTMAPTPAAGVPPAPVAAAPSASSPPPSREDALSFVHQRVVEMLGLRGMRLAELPDQRARALEVAESAAQGLAARGLLPPTDSVDELAQAAAARAVGLDLIFDLITDDAVVELEITPDRQVLVDRDGRLENVERSLRSEREVIELIHTLAALGGAEAGEEAPLIDVRLTDGTRVVASLPPLAFRGPSLNIRKSTRDYFTLDKLLEYNTVSQPMLTFIDYGVRFRKNMLLSVGPGVSPTATLNALLSQMPTDDRVVSVERGIELHLEGARNVTTLQPRGGVEVLDLVQHAVAMQADRAVIGGLEGMGSAEVLRLLAGPLEGSVLAFPARSPQAALEGLAAAVADELDGGIEEGRRLVARTFPIVLQEHRFLDNSRRITAVGELVVGEDGDASVEDVFSFTPEGVDDNLIVTGTFAASGRTPQFLETLMARGEAEVDVSIFET